MHVNMVKIEEYLDSLPPDILNGDNVQLPDRTLRNIFEFAGLGRNDVFCHLGCGDGRGLEMALQEFGVLRAVGVDIDAKKIDAARARCLQKAKLVCDDVRNCDLSDYTVILFWFADPDILEGMVGRLASARPGCRVIMILDPLADYKPDRVKFPYLEYRVPFTKARDVGQQILEIFGVPCIDFTTAWEHAERYSKAVGATNPTNRFLTILQCVTLWINAKNHGVACGEQVPEPIKSYISILREFFNIDVSHLLKTP